MKGYLVSFNWGELVAEVPQPRHALFDTVRHVYWTPTIRISAVPHGAASAGHPAALTQGLDGVDAAHGAGLAANLHNINRVVVTLQEGQRRCGQQQAGDSK